MLNIYQHKKSFMFHIVNEEGQFLSGTPDKYGNIRFVKNLLSPFSTFKKEVAEQLCNELNKKHRSNERNK